MQITQTEWARLQEIIDDAKYKTTKELFAYRTSLYLCVGMKHNDQIQVCFTYDDGIDSEIRCSLFKNSTGESYWDIGESLEILKWKFLNHLDILPEKSVAQLRVEAAQAELDAAIKAMEGSES